MRKVLLFSTILLFIISCDEEAVNTCDTPVSVIIQDVSSSTVGISWLSTEEAQRYEIQFGISGFALGDGQIVEVNDQVTRIEDLASGTTYDIYVRAICSNTSTSNWTAVESFTTLPACTEILSTSVSNITQTAAFITWEISGNLPISYIIEFAEEGFIPGQGNIAETSVTNIPLMNLMAGIRYHYYLTSKCAGQNLGERIGPFTFETLQ